MSINEKKIQELCVFYAQNMKKKKIMLVNYNRD